ncbi:MAG: DMT family transporter [Dongiaceae bacterium]
MTTVPTAPPAAAAPDRLAAGAACSLLAFASLAAMNALAKAAAPFASTTMIVLVQNAGCLLLVLPWALKDGRAGLRTGRLGMHLFRAATGTGAWFCLMLAIRMLPLPTAVLLTYSAPLWMPLIAWAATRERVAPRVWIGAALGFAGIALVLHPSADLPLGGAAWGLAAALLLALALLAVRWLGSTEPTPRILFYYFLLSTAIMVPPAAIEWTTPAPLGWLYLAGVAVGLALGQLFIVIAYRYASAVRLSPFIYSVIVFTALIDWAVWGRPPSPLELAGMALVVGAGILAARPAAS